MTTMSNSSRVASEDWLYQNSMRCMSNRFEVHLIDLED